MGFRADEASAALRSSNGNVQQAIDALLNRRSVPTGRGTARQSSYESRDGDRGAGRGRRDRKDDDDGMFHGILYFRCLNSVTIHIRKFKLQSNVVNWKSLEFEVYFKLLVVGSRGSCLNTGPLGPLFKHFRVTCKCLINDSNKYHCYSCILPDFQPKSHGLTSFATFS